MSKLIVNTIEAQTFNYDSDTTGMTITSAGIVNHPQRIIKGYYLTSNYTTTTSATTMTGWTNIDGNYFKSNGPSDAITESSGVFTFGYTGMYRVYATICANTGSSTRWIQCDIRHAHPGGSYGGWDQYNYMQETESTTTYTQMHRERYINVTTTGSSGNKIILQIGSNQAISIRGTAAKNTVIYFERIGDAVT